MYGNSCVSVMLLSRVYISHQSHELIGANTTLPMLSGLFIVSLMIICFACYVNLVRYNAQFVTIHNRNLLYKLYYRKIWSFPT